MRTGVIQHKLAQSTWSCFASIHSDITAVYLSINHVLA